MMYFTPNMGYKLDSDIYTKDRFRNFETLNIFTDGSFINYNSIVKVGGYCAVGVVNHDIIEITRRSWTSSDPFSINVMELYGIREAISMAFMNKDKYASINIFSDSEYAINAIKWWIYKWHFDPQYQRYVKKGTIPANIDIIYEVAMNFCNLMYQCQNLNIYYVKAHVGNFGNLKEVNNAVETFRRINKITDKVDINLMRYLCMYNNVADKQAKLAVKYADYNCNMHDALIFKQQDINKLVQDKINTNIKYN